MNNDYINNYVEILENENKEFKSQINKIQLQKNKCESLNNNLSLLAISSSMSTISLFMLLIYVIKRKNK